MSKRLAQSGLNLNAHVVRSVLLGRGSPLSTIRPASSVAARSPWKTSLRESLGSNSPRSRSGA